MRYIAVTAPDINNGIGCRVTLWVAGCGHHCTGCHNAWAKDYNIGHTFDNVRPELYKWLAKPYIKGLTLSGGDPLSQNAESLRELVTIIKNIRKEFPGKDIWLYTGYYLEDIENDPDKMAVVKLCDVLVDGPYIEKLRDLSLEFRGSSNQSIFQIKRII